MYTFATAYCLILTYPISMKVCLKEQHNMKRKYSILLHVDDAGGSREVLCYIKGI